MMTLIVLASGLAGCTTVEETSPMWKAPIVERWRLTERAYGAMSESWTTAGDGVIAADAPALYLEPVFRAAPASSESVTPRRYGPCRHRLRVRYEGGMTEVVGTLAEAEIEVPGIPGVAHIFEILSSHPGVEIVQIQGAHSLAGEPGRYVLGTTGRASVRFTSHFVGRGGLEVRLVGETGDATPAGLEGGFETGP